MAKNVIKKKQRVAHNKLYNEDHEMLSEGNDLLFGIFEEMKKNSDLSTIYLNNFESNFSETSKTFTQQNPLNNTNPNPNYTTVPVSKKCGLSRKFPLMEKCTRALKQIKHNRQMPKPRAHLAGQFDMPDKPRVHLGLKKPKIVEKGQKHIGKLYNQKIAEAVEHTRIEKKISQKPIREIPSKNCKSDIKKNSVEETTNVVNNLDKTGDMSSDSDDDKFENFIQKVCPKKSKYKCKKSIKKSKIIKKRISKPISSESDSDTGDDETSTLLKPDNENSKKSKKGCKILDNSQSITSKGNDASEFRKVKKKCNSRAVSKSVASDSDSNVSDKSSKMYYTRSKQIKRKCEVLDRQYTKDSESEMDIVNEETFHDSSSESDLPSLSEGCSQSSEQIGSMHNSVSDFNSHLHKTSDNSLLVMDNKLNEVTLDNTSEGSNNNLCTSSIAFSVNSNLQNSSYKAPIFPSLMTNTHPNVSCKASGTASLVSSSKVNKECISAKNDNVLNNSMQENVNKSAIVDLTESDCEGENSFTIMPKIVMTAGQFPNDSQSHSDESDIELLDVIVNELPEKCPGRNVKPNCPNDSTNRLVKTENVDQAFSCSNNVKSQNIPTSLNTKYEVAYMTGICQGYDKKAEPNVKTTNQSNLNKDKPYSNIVRNADNSKKLSKKVKQEYDDDCEIIIDSDSASNSNLNLPSVQTCNNTKIKIEKDTKVVKEITPVDVARSGSIISEQSNQSSLVNNIKNLPILSKNLKKEPCDDECEIVLDIASTINPKLKLPDLQICNNSNVKIDSDSKSASKDNSVIKDQNNKLFQNEQKLHEVANSNFKNLSTSHIGHSELAGRERISELDTNNIKSILKNLKEEFATYQNILNTEQDVGTVFKLLEKKQAEKLITLQSKLTQCLENTPEDSDSNSIKNAVSELLDSSHLSSSLSLKDCSKVSSICHNVTDISVQDLKTFATMNLVPLSSISENDIKPNLSELQSALKQEVDTSDETNNMSFGEKCIVCAKDASAACQQCAKVFFCSNICGRKYWEDGHKNVCSK